MKNKQSTYFNALAGKKGLTAAISSHLAIVSGALAVVFAAAGAAPLVVAAIALATAANALNVNQCVRLYDAEQERLRARKPKPDLKLGELNRF